MEYDQRLTGEKPIEASLSDRLASQRYLSPQIKVDLNRGGFESATAWRIKNAKSLYAAIDRLFTSNSRLLSYYLIQEQQNRSLGLQKTLLHHLSLNIKHLSDAC
ncbi:hypothetical protein TNCV_745301 [Trichonephila clavipes]|nr:hypothetical protein TNCV_745301 [Trichonephila clavipes]